MNKRILAVVLAMPIVVLLVIICIGKLKGIGRVTPAFVNNDLTFKIDYGSTTNSILQLIIIDTTNSRTIWDISLNFFSGASLKYGAIPKDFGTIGATNSAEQNFPVTGTPLSLVEGKIYELYSDWQVDFFIGAGLESKTEYFKIENKKIIFVKKPSSIN